MRNLQAKQAARKPQKENENTEKKIKEKILKEGYKERKRVKEMQKVKEQLIPSLKFDFLSISLSVTEQTLREGQ